MIHRQAESVETLQAQTDAAYDRWAPVYDLIFDLPFSGGRRAAAEAAGAATPARGELLVVGVGTGLELAMLPAHARVTGVDLSAPMLEVARKRVARRALSHVKALVRMDACQMNFEAASFDTVLAPYVLTVVPKPESMLEDAWRVLKPGGELVVVSHFSAERGLRGRFESWLDGYSDWLGWRPLFPFSILANWVEAHADAEWRERRAIGPMSLFTLARVGKRAV